MTPEVPTLFGRKRADRVLVNGWLNLPHDGYVNRMLVEFWVRAMVRGRIAPPDPPDPYRPRP